MRQAIINAVLGAIFGVLLASMGYPLTTWQFWACFLVFVLAVVNSLIEERS